MALSGKDKLFERHRAFKLFCAKKNPDKIGGFLGQYLFRCPYLSEDYRKDVLAILADGFEPLYEFFYIIHFLNILNKYGIILLIISGI